MALDELPVRFTARLFERFPELRGVLAADAGLRAPGEILLRAPRPSDPAGAAWLRIETDPDFPGVMVGAGGHHAHFDVAASDGAAAEASAFDRALAFLDDVLTERAAVVAVYNGPAVARTYTLLASELPGHAPDARHAWTAYAVSSWRGTLDRTVAR